MDQKKIGCFLKELRKEKGITQEQAAEQFGVAQRTVSRWETGNNMPDLSMLVELAEFYEVDIREIIDGERKSDIMNEEVKETLEKVADYTDTEKEATLKNFMQTSIIVIALSVVEIIILGFDINNYYFNELKTLIPLMIFGMVLGTFVNAYKTKYEMTKFKKAKKAMIIGLIVVFAAVVIGIIAAVGILAL